MIAVANSGYRAIAFDFRGYGFSDIPLEPQKGNFRDLIDDVIGVLDSLGINKVIKTKKDEQDLNKLDLYSVKLVVV